MRLAVLIALCAGLFGAPLAAQTVGKVIAVDQPAMVKAPPEKPSQEGIDKSAELGATVRWRYQLVTGDRGGLQVLLSGGSVLMLGSNTMVVVNKHDARKQQSTFDVMYGRVRFKVAGLTRPDSSFEVRTSSAVFAALGPSDFLIDTKNPTAAIAAVLSGSVAASAVQRKSVTVSAGQEGSISNSPTNLTEDQIKCYSGFGRATTEQLPEGCKVK